MVSAPSAAGHAAALWTPSAPSWPRMAQPSTRSPLGRSPSPRTWVTPLACQPSLGASELTQGHQSRTLHLYPGTSFHPYEHLHGDIKTLTVFASTGHPIPLSSFWVFEIALFYRNVCRAVLLDSHMTSKVSPRRSTSVYEPLVIRCLGGAHALPREGLTATVQPLAYTARAVGWALPMPASQRPWDVGTAVPAGALGETEVSGVCAGPHSGAVPRGCTPAARRPWSLSRVKGGAQRVTGPAQVSRRQPHVRKRKWPPVTAAFSGFSVPMSSAIALGNPGER